MRISDWSSDVCSSDLSVTSTLLGAAIRDGKIKSVDDLVTTYIPELKGGAYDGVTLRQVLAMRSGAQWNEDYTDASSDVGQLAASMAENKGASLIAMMATRPRAAEPGSRFLYSTGERDRKSTSMNYSHK